MVAHQIADIPRIAYNIALSLPTAKSLDQATICDIGGGIGIFSVGCAVIGFRKVVLVDDFRDRINEEVGASIFDIHRHYGVRVISRDVVAQGLCDLDETLDVVTSFDSMEHWHNSPKKLFHELLSMMPPGGRFVLGIPNCVSLRKRLTVPFGRGKWSLWKDWYEPAIFRGHVREPDVQDLWNIAEDLGLKNVSVSGRNWLGYNSSSRFVRILTPFVDHLIRLKPSLCADIYLAGNKPAE